MLLVHHHVDEHVLVIDTARAAELIEQLGITPATEPSEGPCPPELAAAVQRTLALPAIMAVRSRLSSEVPVLAPAYDADTPVAAIAGFADAVALDDDGRVEVVIDWKSDVAPDDRTRGLYRGQVAQYVEALDARQGAVVYMTSGQIDPVDVAN